MGVPKFFRYISERYPCLSEKLKEYQIPEFDNLYLDMNGIIHGCSHPNDSDVHFRITEEDIFKNIFHYVEILFRMIQPQKLFFMAIDGVAPRAKINQQRGRRFRAAKDAEAMEAKARAKGVKIPNEKRFDSNCITPGTLFMAKLNEQLKNFITCKVSTDTLWQKCKIVFSGSEVPGEGEHKIMDYIRYMKAQPDYDPNLRHCLYGLDADLIMLGLCTHEPHFSLLREEVKFGKKQKKILTPEETDFCLLHLSLLRDYIGHEFSTLKQKLPFPFDVEKIIDDWVLIGFLVGNDFIPHLPNLHIAQGALPILYHAYIEVLPTLDGYINEAGTLKLDRFEKFMENLSRIDMKEFAEHYADLKYFEAKTGRRLNESERQSYKKTNSPSADEDSPKKTGNKELNSLIKSTYNMLLEQSDDDELDDESDNEIYNLEFVQHKRDYYMNKMEYEDVDADVLRSQAEGYVRAIQWNLHYYYNGCCSWSWYYPHHYAPYISDIKGFKDLKLEYDLGEPFLPFQQLLAVLPAYSKDLLPEAFQSLLTEEKSPIIDYYPIDFKTDLNGKRQEWEAVVLIPFINEKHLLDAMEPHCLKLTEEEQRRNKHGPMAIYVFTEEDLGVFPETKFFSQVKNRAAVKLVNRDEILVPMEKLVKGLCPGTQFEVYFPGFPTLQYIPHTVTLEKAKVKVFEQPSRGENMILHLKCSTAPSLKEVAAKLLGTVVNVDWPHFTEAQVVAVSNSTSKINLINPQASYSDNNITEEELSGALLTQWSLQCKNITETYKNRRGVDIGKTDILVHARPLVGSKYIFGVQGKIYVEKQWYEVVSTYAFQTVVTNIKVHATDKMLFKTASEIFTPKTACFMLGHPHYGTMGEVVDPGYNAKTGRVRVHMNVVAEPVLSSVKHAQAELKTRYMHGGIAAQRLGISSHLLSRVTGTIYVTGALNDSQVGLTKYNVGLNLKFNKRNEEIPGYTKKENGQWLYSAKAVDLIRSYMATYPDIFEKLAKNVSHDMFSEEELFEKGTSKLDDITTWMKQQEFSGIESRTCGTEVLDTSIVQDIEKEIDNYLETESSTRKVVLMNVKPQLLFKPGLHMRNAPPDPKAQHHLLDRIVCVRNSFTVPLGFKGTIIGIQKKEKVSETIYEVLFDKPFEGGLELNGSSNARAYRLSMPDFVNITYGEKVEQGKSALAEVPGGLTESWRRPANNQNQTLINPSAFASFSKNPNNPHGMPRMPLMMPNFKRENAGKMFTIDNSGQVTAGIHSTNWKQRSSQQHNETEASKRTKDAQQPGNYNQNATAKPSTEFQALWNELHQIQKPTKHVDKQSPATSAVTVKPTNTDMSNKSPQDPSAYLKAVLKINDNVPSNAPPATEVPVPKVPLQQSVSQPANKSSDAPPLVQQLFDHARQTETTQRIVKTPNWYSSQLLNHFQLTGMGMPRYSYFTDDKTKQIRAQILLPDTRIFTGDFCKNPQQATENAAKKVYKELHLDKMAKPDVKLLIPPPQQWFNNAPNNSWPPNLRPPVMSCPRKMHPGIPTPMMHFPKWNPKMQQNPGYAQMTPQNVHIKAQQIHVPSQLKTEIKNSTAFVPLQAQKKSRNPSAKQSAQDSEKSSKLPNTNTKQQNKGECSKSTTQQGVSSEKEVSKDIETSQTSLSNQDKSQQKHHYDEKFEIKSRTFTSSLQKKNKTANMRQMSKESEEGVNFANQHGTQQTKDDSKVAKMDRQNRGSEKECDAQGMHHGSSKPQKSANPRRSRVAAKFGAPPVTNGKPQIGKPQ